MTQKPLKDLIPDILAHIDQYKPYLEFNLRLYKILEGQIREEVEQSLRREIISQSALHRALQRIPPINVLRKAVDKLSKVYIESPLRLADSSSDQDIMMNIARTTHLDNVMMNANRMYNAHGMFAIEPYVERGQHKFRVLGGHQFLPFSDDPKNPKNMTVLIKLLEPESVRYEARFDENGREVARSRVETVEVYALYSDDEFMIIDSKGSIRLDKMRAMGLTGTTNPFGRIPFIYGNRSAFELIPFPNQEGLDVSILIPKLLTDLNYAAQFMSHSIIWARNADLSGQEINPDAIVDLGERNPDGGEPELGTIDPKVDIHRILGLVEYEMRAYFSSIGIKIDSQIFAGETASGVSKALDEGDTTAERKVQTEFFRRIETELWDLMQTIQRVWSRDNVVVENRNFSSNFSDSFRVKFAEMKPLKSNKEKIEEVQLMRDQKLMTREQALKFLNPDFTDDQIRAWVRALDQEVEQDFERALEGLPTLQAERKADGTFSSGNTASQNQSPAAHLDNQMSKRGQ